MTEDAARTRADHPDRADPATETAAPPVPALRRCRGGIPDITSLVALWLYVTDAEEPFGERVMLVGPPFGLIVTTSSPLGRLLDIAACGFILWVALRFQVKPAHRRTAAGLVGRGKRPEAPRR